jgi:hypothetical protein
VHGHEELLTLLPTPASGASPFVRHPVPETEGDTRAMGALEREELEDILLA